MLITKQSTKGQQERADWLGPVQFSSVHSGQSKKYWCIGLGHTILDIRLKLVTRTTKSETEKQRE